MEDATNVAPHPTAHNDSGNGGDSGDRLATSDVLREVEKRVRDGASIREAAEDIAAEVGKKPSAVRSAYARANKKGRFPGPVPQVTCIAQAPRGASCCPFPDQAPPGREGAFYLSARTRA